MKTKEELLKIYSAYLPYELKIYHESNFKDNRIIEIWGLKNCSDYPISEYCDGTRYGRTFQEVKPILYPMDMLTKEIEHKGERFIPMDELTNGKTVSGNLNDYAEDWNQRTYHPFEDYVDEWVNGESGYHLDFLPYGFIQKLLEWHFNVFGLEESEYIKKESLK